MGYNTPQCRRREQPSVHGELRGFVNECECNVVMNVARLPFHRFLVTIFCALIAGMAGGLSARGQGIILLPSVPTVSVKAVQAETREPFCDPAICDAAPPPPGVVRVTRAGGDLSRDLSVFISIEGTAGNGIDIAKLPEAVHFPAGSETADLFVDASYDQLFEGDEFVVVRLLPDPSMGPIGLYRIDPSNSEARVVIRDHQIAIEPTVSIEATGRIAEETSHPYRRLAFRGVFTISRTGPTNTALPVFVHYGGTATPGVDFPAPPWLVTIPEGAEKIELTVEPFPDNVAEPIEILDATLSQCPPPTQPPLGIPCYAVNIDPARATARVFLRDDGITTATLNITSPKNGALLPFGQPVQILATAIDLDDAITFVEFFDGETKVGESAIFFVRQPDPGTPVEHAFSWNAAAVGSHRITARAAGSAGTKVISAPVEFQVADRFPVVSIEATVPETTEPSPTSRIRPAAFTLRRTGAVERSLRVWMQYGGTAVSGSDYDPLPPTVEFPAGAESVELLVVPIDDALVETDETVIAELTASPLVVLPDYQMDPAKSRAEVMIHDNGEALPHVSIRATQPVTSEPCPICLVAPGVFTISRTGNTGTALGVHYRLGGTALNGEDYERLSGYAVIPAGEDSVDVRVLGIMDAVAETDETVVATLVVPDVVIAIYPPPPPPYQVDPTAASATVTIRNYPFTPAVPVVAIIANDPFGREGGLNGAGRNTVEFTIRRSGGTAAPLVVHFALGGTATPGLDYFLPASPIVIPAGQSRAKLILEPLDDTIAEPVESVVVTLTPDPTAPETYSLGLPRRAAAILVDNDRPRPPCVRLPDGSFHLCLPAGTNSCFRIESTEDFKAWTPLGIVPVNEDHAQYVDPEARGTSRRFYRLIPVPCE